MIRKTKFSLLQNCRLKYIEDERRALLIKTKQAQLSPEKQENNQLAGKSEPSEAKGKVTLSN